MGAVGTPPPVLRRKIAMSVAGSVPTTVAANSRPSVSFAYAGVHAREHTACATAKTYFRKLYITSRKLCKGLSFVTRYTVQGTVSIAGKCCQPLAH